MGGGMAESARTSLRSRGAPINVGSATERERQKTGSEIRAAAKEMRDDQRSVKAEVAAARQVAGTARARQRASKRTKLAASLLPPPGVADLGTPPQERGFMALGTPHRRRNTSALGAWKTMKNSKLKTRCSASSPCCLTSSARGSSSAFAQRRGRTTR